MAVDYKAIGERLKKARKENHLTQEELAEEMNVSVAFLSRIERGSSLINLKRLGQMCEILNVTEGEILNGTTSKSPKYLNTEFSDILESCSPKNQRLIYDIAKVISDSDKTSKKV